MNYKFLFFLFTAILLGACNRHQTQDNTVLTNEDQHYESAFTNVSETTLLNNVNTFTEIKIPTSWISSEQLNGVYTKLERDKEGFLVYNPYNGNTPRIAIDSHALTVYWWLDGPSTFRITKQQISADKKTIYLDAETIDGLTAEFECNLAHGSKHLLRWNFTINWSLSQGGRTTYTWATTPKELEHTFRYIDQKSNSTAGMEKEFLPAFMD